MLKTANQSIFPNQEAISARILAVFLVKTDNLSRHPVKGHVPFVDTNLNKRSKSLTDYLEKKIGANLNSIIFNSFNSSMNCRI